MEQVTIENIEVTDLYDATRLGKTICGKYVDGKQNPNSPMWDGHFRQTEPMQVGFSGNMNQGININAAQSVSIKDVVIDNIVSETGAAFGISIWPACEVTIEGDIKISNIKAGIKVEEDTFAYSDRPNKAPEACGFRVWYEWDDVTSEITEDNAEYDIDSDSISGHVGCLGSDSIYDHNSEDDFYSNIEALSSIDYANAPDAPDDDLEEYGPEPNDEPRGNDFGRGESGFGSPDDRRLSYHSQFASGKESKHKHILGYNVSFNGLVFSVTGILVGLLLVVCAYGFKHFTSLKANVYDGYTVIKESST